VYGPDHIVSQKCRGTSPAYIYKNNVETYINTTQHHNPEDLNLNAETSMQHKWN